MGINNFYSQFKQLFPQSIIQGSKVPKFDCICFDLNQWIHANFSKCDTTDSLAIMACRYIQEFQQRYMCSTVVVVMDGICPYPKLTLQKARRQNVESDRLLISANTDFMQEFSQMLLALLKSNVSFEHLYYSDSSYKGEGEHKIARIIQKCCLKNVLVICIDADFLMLVILQQLCTVFVLRKCRFYCEIIEMDVVLRNLPCTAFSFFINVCFLGNDYLPKLCSKISNYDFDEDLKSLCTGSVYDSECQSYLDYLSWITAYYRDMNIERYPLTDVCPKVTLDQLRRHQPQTVVFTAKKPEYNSNEFHLLYTIPKCKYLPASLKIYFLDFQDFLGQDDIETFIDFWSEILTYSTSRIRKFSRNCITPFC